MARAQVSYACQTCGSSYKKWQGKCDGCNEWNTIVEEASVVSSVPKGLKGKKGRVIPLTSLSTNGKSLKRLLTGINEFDRTLGGGLVPGSATLLGGDPGIGKSTLLLQVVGNLAKAGKSCVYISGEEAADQVAMRAERLGLADAQLQFGAETNVRDILTTLANGKPPEILVIDSIQTMFVDEIDAAPGTVSQVRSSTSELIRFAKSRGTALLLVGHVTKDGQIAGPRVMEHMVDTVLYFEGDRGHQFRILRSVKNRFGGTDEIGVYEMTGLGLEEVSNPSSLFLADRSADTTGSAVFAGMEGSRPLLVEIQALVAPSPAANPRRAVVGWDSGRLAMVLAVLDSKLGLGFAGADVYLNVAGGLKINEPAADLAVAVALMSSLSQKPFNSESIVFGEIALSGDVRPVAQAEARLKEAEKLGFNESLIPKSSKAGTSPIKKSHISKVQDLMGIFDLGSKA